MEECTTNLDALEQVSLALRCIGLMTKRSDSNFSSCEYDIEFPQPESSILPQTLPAFAGARDQFDLELEGRHGTVGCTHGDSECKNILGERSSDQGVQIGQVLLQGVK